ncbi:hypothetical protein LTR35_005357 [Friedmanniomyces endolithicus]|nr:hypothetical protein LTR35_005357 [Friedmanniomyces endolithicus]KAK1019230.1 hypothetical protein LTR54_001045 [Friedmanniomyces endolithicus]
MTPASGTRPLPPHSRPRPSTHADSDGKGTLPPHLPTRVPTLPPHLRPRPSTQTEPEPERAVPVPQACTTHASFHDSVVSLFSPPVTKSSADDVRAKLSEFGVKVSASKPVAANVIEGNIDGNHSSVREPRQSSLASRGRGHGRGTADPPKRSDQAETAAEIHREPHQAPFRNQCRQSRDARKPPRASRWPTNKELAAPKPRKHDKGPMSVSGWSVDAALAEGGIRAPADEVGFKLADWNGDWAPAPLNWDARPPFADPLKAARIECWLREMKCDVRPASADTLLATDELAPRYWVPTYVANQSPSEYFKQLVASHEPAPVDTDDLFGVVPWWKLYQTGTSSKLQPYSPPSLAGVDPDETPDERLARENDHGADKHLENKKRTESAKKAAKRDQKAKKLAKGDSNPKGTSAGTRIKPALNLYLRSARPADMEQIRDIYNHHIAFTSCAPETQSLTTPAMQSRLESVLASGLPFLVACERGGKIPARRSRKRYGGKEEDLILPDRVVGFAMAQEFGDDGLGGMYRFACEIRVWVKQECYMKGVAKCLVDKLLALLDPGYAEAGGFEVQGEELEGGCVPRVVQSVTARVPYEKPERLEWTGRWLRSLGFEQVADLPGIGWKDGKSVSLAMFMRKTGAVVDEATPLA